MYKDLIALFLIVLLIILLIFCILRLCLRFTKRLYMSSTDDPIKLLVNNLLLEQEARLNGNFNKKLDEQTEKIRQDLNTQNQLFSGNILQLTSDVATLQEKLRIQNVKMLTLSAASTSVGAIVGFFIANVLK